MDKLQKYNQRLLAVLGTIAVVALVLLVLIMGGVMINEVMRSFQFNDQTDNGLILANDSTETKENAEEFIRKQELTLGTPRLIDTLNAIYLIPVSQVNLKDPEYVRADKVQGLLESSSSKRYWSYSGYFNNVILYDQKAQSKTAVFEEKILIAQFQHREINDQLFLFIQGVTEDSNGNQKLDGTDLKSFYTYNIRTQELSTYEFVGFGLDNYYVTHNSGEVMVRFTKDKDGDGEIDQYREPTIIKSLNLKTGEMTDLVNDQMMKKLQQLID